MPIIHPNLQTTKRQLTAIRVFGTAIIATMLILAGCSSSNSEPKFSSTDSLADIGTPPPTQPSGDTTDSSTGGTTTESAGSDLPDPCTLLTPSDLNTVLVGADEGTRQLSACVWTDPEGTAARLVLNRPSQGTPLDTSQGSPLEGVGDEAIVALAPGTVRIIARANGIEVAFSVDTGTSDIKPNQANAVTLVKEVIEQLP